ncbi:hypothetical protein A9Q96_10075 [Rhodobacterales bacterium 52_120_T64]|nr:hypothetical protein A9Q96_10075 [Rhodobacterales bacterium 52_120_T64]
MAGSPEGDAAAKWFGQAAKEEGLTGRVDDARFAQLLDGQAPNGRLMGRTQGGERQHRPGIDLTFSASKTVSIMALVAGDERVVQAHDKAVTAAMEYVENKLVGTRRQVNGEVKTITGGKIIAGMFRHDTSRALDPQLHTHVVIANMIKGDDGQYTALHNDQIYRNKMIGGEVYRSELAKELKTLGFEVERVGKHRFVEIKGVDPKLVETYSKRRTEVLEAIENRDVGATAKNNALAALATRATKNQAIDRSELATAWVKEANSIGISKEMLESLSKDASDKSHYHLPGVTRDGKGINHAQSEAKESVQFAIKHISERNSVYEAKDVIHTALKRSESAGIKEITGEITRLVKTGALIEGKSGAQTLLTDKETLLIERETIREFRKTVREDGPRLKPSQGPSGRIKVSGDDYLKRSLSKTTLTTGQKEAIETSLTGKGRYVAVQGYAGSGKTFMMEKLQGYAERSGYAVEGLAPTNKAVEKLKEALPDSRTLQSLLTKNQYNPQTENKSKTILVVDEASMTTTKDMKVLMDYANAAKYARVVLVGDQKQLDAVGAGTPFAALQKAGMPTAVMTDIQRQRNPDALDAVNYSIKGEIRAAFDKIGDKIRENPYELTKTVANDWLRRPSPMREQTSIVVSTNAMRQTINRHIRSELIVEGKVAPDGNMITALEPMSFSRAEAGDAKSYSTGDQVVSINPIKKHELKAGEVYTVTARDTDKNEITIEKNGNTITLPLGQASKVAASLAVYQASQKEVAPGDKVKLRITDKDHGIKNGDHAVVTEIDEKTVTLDLANGKETALPLESLAAKGIDHAYVATAHDLQGSTVENIIVAMSSNEMLATQKSFYVGISRAKEGVTLVTDDVERLAKRLEKTTGDRVSALDAYMEKHISDQKEIEKPEQKSTEKTRTSDLDGKDKSMEALAQSFREAEEIKNELIEIKQKQIEGPIR